MTIVRGCCLLDKTAQALINEIHGVIAPKKYNIEHGTATQAQIDIVKECLGFLSLVRFSALKTKTIKKLWEDSNLKYM